MTKITSSTTLSPAWRDLHRPGRVPEPGEDQHLQLVQDRQDFVQAETVFHPGTTDLTKLHCGVIVGMR